MERPPPKTSNRLDFASSSRSLFDVGALVPVSFRKGYETPTRVADLADKRLGFCDWLAALENELVELCPSDHSPEQHSLLRPEPSGFPLHPRKSPRRGGDFNCRQRPILIVATQAPCDRGKGGAEWHGLKSKKGFFLGAARDSRCARRLCFTSLWRCVESTRRAGAQRSRER